MRSLRNRRKGGTPTRARSRRGRSTCKRGNTINICCFCWCWSDAFCGFSMSDWAFYLLAVGPSTVGIDRAGSLPDFCCAAETVCLSSGHADPVLLHTSWLNHNVVPILLWAITTYTFFRAYKSNNIWWSILTGVAAASVCSPSTGRSSCCWAWSWPCCPTRSGAFVPGVAGAVDHDRGIVRGRAAASVVA